MRARLRDNAWALCFAALGLTLLGWLSLGSFEYTDYDNEASAAYAALTAGHPLQFLQLAPGYGGSLILRAPLALLPGLWHGGQLAVYRTVSLPALLGTGAFGVWLVARMRKLGRPRLARATVLALCVFSPVALAALQFGHPEEVIGAVLCVAALLAARAGRVGWAGMLLGLAVANKPWALVAVLPVVFAAEARRVRLLVVAAAVAALVLAPLVIAQRATYAGGAGGGAQAGPIFRPFQVWWWLGSDHRVVRGSNGQIKPGFRAAPAWVGGFSHPLVVLIAVALTVLWLRRRARRPWEALGLLTLLLLLRCLLDPWNVVYYAVPFLFSLLAWEALTRRDPPVVTLACTVAVWASTQELPTHLSPDAQSVAYLAWAVPVACGIGLWLYAPATWARLRGALELRRTPASGRQPLAVQSITNSSLG